MNKTLIILCLVLLTSCGPSQEEKKKVAAVTCSIIGETRNMDGAVRVREMNEARDQIGGEPYLKGDDAIKEALEWGLCQELVLNETYDEILQLLKGDKRERDRMAAEKQAKEKRITAEKQAEKQRVAAAKQAEEEKIAAEKQRIAAEKQAEKQRIAAAKQRIAAEKQAEKQRIANSKRTVKETFYSDGKLESRTNYQSKTDGGKEDGLTERYDENGQLRRRANYKGGGLDGLFESYHENGQLEYKGNYKDGKKDGLEEWYFSDGKPQTIDCYDNGEKVDMSRCEK